MLEAVLGLGVAGVVAIGFWLWKNTNSTVVYQTQKGLLFKDGKLVKQLDAGHYRHFSGRSRIDVYDIRKQTLNVPGQEVLTKDHIAVRTTVVGQIQISDPQQAALQTENYLSDVYAIVQLALRDVVGGVTLDELLLQKKALDQQIQENVAAQVTSIGVVVTGLTIRDVMLPANLKKAYGGVLEAQKAAQVNLEKARGEQAVLRSLANSSKLYAENPSLLQARVIQALATGNNSIVFGADDSVSVKKSK